MTNNSKDISFIFELYKLYKLCSFHRQNIYLGYTKFKKFRLLMMLFRIGSMISDEEYLVIIDNKPEQLLNQILNHIEEDYTENSKLY